MCCFALAKIVVIVVMLALGGAARGHAQQVTTLLQFTNVWKYDQSGRELGTAWRTNDYDDSAWPSGRGLLGLEPDTPVLYQLHAPITTPLTISSTVTTFYFRTTFEITSGTAGLSLVSSNLVDDGCAIYLNGMRAGGVRASATYNATTFFQGPSTEGQLDVLTFTNLSALRPGENLLAVEVHQNTIPSSDIMWGMKLMAIRQTPLTITNQPQNLSVNQGDPIALTVGVSGGPAFYQWQKDGANIPNATNSTYSIPSAQLTSGGGYRVVITNLVSAVTSTVATVAVIADTTGPRMTAAIIANLVSGSSTPLPSNTINVTFNERLTISTTSGVQGTNNYAVTLYGTTNRIPVVNAVYNSQLGALLTVDATNPNWTPTGEYLLTVNHVQDLQGNPIAPDSQIAVSRLRISSNNIPLADNVWSFHASAVFDPGIYDEPWQATDYIEGSWWAQGRGLFRGGPVLLTPCVGAFRTETGFQPEPSLFRTAFLWPTDWRTSLTLRFNMTFDDGLVLYLNGTEIFRTNASSGPLTAFTRSPAISTYCLTNFGIAVTNLRPGTNWLAAGVVQTVGTSESDSIFGIDSISATVTDLVAPPLPEAPAPTLNLTPMDTNAIRLSWTGGGYALESTTNLNLGPASYPIGPWQQVPKLSNPYTNRLDETQRFFRLKK